MRSALVSVALALLAAADHPDTASVDPPGVLVGRVARHVVSQGESLRSIGARLGIDTSTLAADNGIQPRSVLRVGDELITDNRHIIPSALTEGVILVNVPQRMLFWRAGDRLVAAPVAVGSRTWQTPIAAFTVVAMEMDPTWDVPESIAAEARARGQHLPRKVPPGPQNPLGRHWLGLSVGSIGLHGTNAPTSIYGAVTHGCIRMHGDDIAALFDAVAVRTAGATIYEPLLMADDGTDVFLEVHPDVYRRDGEPPLMRARALATLMGVVGRIDWLLAQRVIDRREGIARVVTARSLRKFPARREKMR